MVDLPLKFQVKAELLSGFSEAAVATSIEPSTCVDAEPYALQVLDDSMAPEFWSGCIILIDPTGRATDGCFVLAKTNSVDTSSDASADSNSEEAYIFRQLRQSPSGNWTLEALASAYPSIALDQQLSDVVGVIVQRAGKRRSQHKRYDQQ